eukprot:8616971-Alexandrium_andersonii.AAC.1
MGRAERRSVCAPFARSPHSLFVLGCPRQLCAARRVMTTAVPRRASTALGGRVAFRPRRRRL